MIFNPRIVLRLSKIVLDAEFPAPANGTSFRNVSEVILKVSKHIIAYTLSLLSDPVDYLFRFLKIVIFIESENSHSFQKNLAYNCSRQTYVNIWS